MIPQIPQPRPLAVNPLIRSAFSGWAPFLMVVLLVQGAYGVRLDAVPLWGDEGDTGFFSRSTLETWLPHAVLGNNVAATSNCYQLSSGLLSRQLPWLQYYTGALSIATFGDDTAGLRRLFSIAGALAAVPLYLLLRHRTSWPGLVALVTLLHPQSLLFARQARYYPLVMLLAAWWVWLAIDGPSKRGTRLLLNTCVATLLFHAHPVAAFSLWGALVIHSILWPRAPWWHPCVAGGIGLASWLGWYVSMAPASATSVSSWSIAVRAPLAWAVLAGRGVVAGISDLDYTGTLPLLAWAVIMCWGSMTRAARETTQPSNRALRDLLLLAVAISTVTAAVLIGVEGTAGWAVLRYAPHAVPFAILALWLAITALPVSRGLTVILWLAITACNLGSLNHWLTLFPRPSQPVSWWPAVYAEVAGGVEDLVQVETAIRRLPSGSAVLILPRWWNDVWLYRVGDHVRLIPDIDPASPCGALVGSALDEATYLNAMAPDFILAYASDVTPPRIRPLHVFRMSRVLSDGSRPELTRHEFAGTQSPGGLVVLSTPVSAGR